MIKFQLGQKNLLPIHNKLHQIQQMIQGLLALAQLSGIGDTDENSKHTAAMLKSIKIEREKTVVRLVMDTSIKTVTASLRYQMGKAKEEKKLDSKEEPKEK